MPEAPSGLCLKPDQVVVILYDRSLQCPCGAFLQVQAGDRLTIISGRHKGATGVVDSAVFQRTVDYPDEYGPGYNVVPDDWTVKTAYTIRAGRPEL